MHAGDSDEPVADYSRPLSASEQDKAAEIIRCHDPTPQKEAVGVEEQLALLSETIKTYQSTLNLVVSKLAAGGLISEDEAGSALVALTTNPVTPDYQTVT